MPINSRRPPRAWVTLLVLGWLSACGGQAARAERPEAPPTMSAAPGPRSAASPRTIDATVIEGSARSADEDAPPRDASAEDADRPLSPDTPLVALALPMSGGARRLGQNLEQVARHLAATESPPTLRLAVIDAHSPEVAVQWASLRQQSAAGVVLVTPDRAVVASWVEQARSGGLPLVVVSSADEALASPGQAWRAIHGAKLVARTLAGAVVARGIRRIGVVASDSATDESGVRLLKAAFKAGGAEVAFELRHPVTTPDWAAVSKQTKAAVEGGIDALAVLEPPVAASQLLAHLARHGVWSSGVVDVPKGQRSVLVLGTPEWDDPALLAQSARYFEGALVPSPFANETPAGAAMKARLQSVGLRATALDALMWESLMALASAGRPGGAALSASPFAQWTSGLDFSSPDALKRLFVLEFAGGKLVPAR